MTESVFLSRREAADYLKRKFGAPGAVTSSTLAKLAVIGGGPILHRFGRKVAYKVENLDSWAMSRCSGPMRSTSDCGKRNEAAMSIQDSLNAPI
jgi:hypothetical protein